MHPIQRTETIMRIANTFLASVAVFMLGTSSSWAAGELHIFNWGNYTSQELLDKFSKTYDVKVTLDTYDSNETMIAKVKAGGSGYDIVVPSDYAVQIMIEDGLLEKTEPAKMSNAKNIKPDALNLYFDDGRHYTVPWQMGTTALSVDTTIYKGDINTYAVLFDPPAELKGRINILDDMTSTMHAAERYLGFPRCTSDRAQLKKVAELLNKAKPSWRTFSYDATTLLPAKEVDASMVWNGAAYRARKERPELKYGYPKEGIEGFTDSVAVLKDAANKENAKLFQNFIMEPQNAALISAFATYNNGITGADEFLPADMKSSPEFSPPAGVKPEFVPPCPQEVVDIYNQIWTNLRK
jgi:spermidine/putrescine transport system substrate-binding protein